MAILTPEAHILHTAAPSKMANQTAHSADPVDLLATAMPKKMATWDKDKGRGVEGMTENQRSIMPQS
jgi:hypothetical protein